MPSQPNPHPHARITVWLAALRLRTLPLAGAAMLAAAMLAWQQQVFQAALFIASLSTAVLLQIFSNLANDYGDAAHGADRQRRHGPVRAVAAGLIAPLHMRRALLGCALLCMASGLWLLAISLPALHGWAAQWWLWLLLGTLALLAAWAYTAGHRPYGYVGLGDAAVWLFFGLLAVLGGSVLYGAAITWPAVAAANALGLWCTAVLNINNMRDIPTDLAAGKHTIAARLGLRRAGRYHAVLLGLAAASWGVWLYHSLPPMAAILLASALLLFYRHHDHALRSAPQRPHEYNRQLAQLSLFILLWVGANALAMGSFHAA
ncbi:1,4-dihydroxy-2-naphthoate octaprenyltransferase [Paralysiella testudinis]|uniref:1,4-dihydroxy-2-naphthoate octaprenyltransferase n=1 Tax=Paralysiella testudinis TaxID=2809020 RepID=A0A892ZJU0_9NEIS|nr:1,4-dihydroxy-2-naphthoate octaprenyltransferase [Paralysiella testudinis]QRQ82730.1 1,4-dihydroxy-2-naphthoate octaprenyltransferase [Paralysiella testudinis]